MNEDWKMKIPGNYGKEFSLLQAAALARNRCPMTAPNGPLRATAITALWRAGCIRSEVYKHNFRVVTILVGPHAGQSTMPAPGRFPTPYRVDGELLRK